MLTVGVKTYSWIEVKSLENQHFAKNLKTIRVKKKIYEWLNVIMITLLTYNSSGFNEPGHVSRIEDR